MMCMNAFIKLFYNLTSEGSQSKLVIIFDFLSAI